MIFVINFVISKNIYSFEHLKKNILLNVTYNNEKFTTI